MCEMLLSTLGGRGNQRGVDDPTQADLNTKLEDTRSDFSLISQCLISKLCTIPSTEYF